MCTDISVCAAKTDYSPPVPTTTPLFKYLQSESASKISPTDAVTKVDQLLKKKQCYAYAITTMPSLYSYDKVSRKFVIPQDADYEYSEKKLLRDINIGKFGFGVDVPQPVYGYYYDNMYIARPTNYNYYQDWDNLRWKHIDIVLGLVNKDAI